MIHSVGHSNLAAADFLALLREFAIEVLVDIRRQPRSRRHPHFERNALAATLAAAGIDYLWWGEALGGRRAARADSPNVALTDMALRGYADHMLGEEFRAAAQALAALAAQRPVAFMCAEADYTHCHRQLLADHLQQLGTTVCHIAGPRRSLPHVRNAALGDACDPPVYNRRAQGDLFA
jgi:uncharacterized protein (DUF488 family)